MPSVLLDVTPSSVRWGAAACGAFGVAGWVGSVKDLLETYVPRVYKFALRLTGNREDAEDLTQEALVQALRRRARLRVPTATRAWLFTITFNLWRSGLRRKAREEGGIRRVEQLVHRHVPLPEQRIVVEENMRRVREAMDNLPPRQREVLYLHAYEALSLDEVAGILGISSEAVKASLSLARKRMRQQFRDLDGRPPTT